MQPSSRPISKGKADIGGGLGFEDEEQFANERELQIKRFMMALDYLNRDSDSKEGKKLIKHIKDAVSKPGFDSYVEHMRCMVNLGTGEYQVATKQNYGDLMAYKFMKADLFEQDHNYLTQQFLSNFLPDPESMNYRKIDFAKFEQAVDSKAQRCFVFGSPAKSKELLGCFLNNSKEDPAQRKKCQELGHSMLQKCYEGKLKGKISKVFGEVNKADLKGSNQYTSLKKDLLQQWHKNIKNARQKPGFSDYIHCIAKESNMQRLVVDAQIQKMPEFQEFLKFVETAPMQPMQKQELAKSVQLVMYITELQNGRCFAEKLVQEEGKKLLQCFLKNGKAPQSFDELTSDSALSMEDPMRACHEMGIDMYKECRDKVVVPQVKEFCTTVLKKIKKQLKQGGHNDGFQVMKQQKMKDIPDSNTTTTIQKV